MEKRLIDANSLIINLRTGMLPYNKPGISGLPHDNESFLDYIEREPTVEINGETSDGYHTFNELYHHRAVLFSVIVRIFKDHAWKSKLHADGTMYDGMFIVGIDTPHGQATYHYDVEPYWRMFDCPVLDRAPEWDGHTPTQALERIRMLGMASASKPESEESIHAQLGSLGEA